MASNQHPKVVQVLDVAPAEIPFCDEAPFVADIGHQFVENCRLPLIPNVVVQGSLHFLDGVVVRLACVSDRMEPRDAVLR